MTCTCLILTGPSSLHLVGVCEFQQEAPWDANETNQIEVDGTCPKGEEIRHQDELSEVPAKDSFEGDTVCPVGVQNRVSSSRLSRPEHGFIPRHFRLPCHLCTRYHSKQLTILLACRFM